MTYNEILTEIRRINCDPVIGAGKFTKEEHLADRICALLSQKRKGTLLLDQKDVTEAPENGVCPHVS
jgi:hypothetical protein